MYLDVNNMLIKDKDIKKITKQDGKVILKLVENDNPEFIELSFNEFTYIRRQLIKNMYKTKTDMYYIPSIYDMDKQNGVGCLYYNDGSMEKVSEEDYQKISELFNRYKNPDEYQL